ncbi:hypothetical protein E2C01_063510 [Portunus trituberculatus]|uniref:Uncharacterized protein n=1 Tax=Portunus trituberculatus TaxID=210409 RepID=A0A5B7H9C6_PORTR|nr:hypothetical protein [Portunus trituberculatus]
MDTHGEEKLKLMSSDLGLGHGRGDVISVDSALKSNEVKSPSRSKAGLLFGTQLTPLERYSDDSLGNNAGKLSSMV